jgi:hypothetical protein
MSYDLNFWRYQPGITPDADALANELTDELAADQVTGLDAMSPAARLHLAVYRRLSNGQPVPWLADIPTELIVARIASAFARGWQQTDPLSWEKKPGKGAFQVSTSPQHLRVDCYGMAGQDMNRLIDIALEFDLPLYDPQAGIRFDGEGT